MKAAEPGSSSSLLWTSQPQSVASANKLNASSEGDVNSETAVMKSLHFVLVVNLEYLKDQYTKS